MDSRTTCDHINSLVKYMVLTGLADDQQFAFERLGNVDEVTFKNSSYRTFALKDVPYEELYRTFADNRVFNVKLLDGALIQMEYAFKRREILKHRLAFIPSPFLVQFERDPDLYEEDNVYTEIVARSVVPVPIRFDFDNNEEIHDELYHPKSHMTLGVYQRCRIAVSSPVTPLVFVEFILRHFYRTQSKDFSLDLPKIDGTFGPSITRAERNRLHVMVNQSSMN